MRRKHPRNELFMSRAEPIIALFHDEIPRIALEVKALNQAYKNDRRDLMETVAKYPKHNSLALTWKPDDLHDGRFPFGRIYWVRGHYKHNNQEAVRLRAHRTVLTRKLHNCGDSGDYTKSNIRDGLRYAEPWEIKLTWQYELEAQKLREYLRGLSQISNSLVWCPPYPDIPAGGPNATDPTVQ